jgi:DNA polymerase I-like protein with 3'-5' exonuclease and polymerase domains
MGRIVKDHRQVPMDFMVPETSWEAPTRLPDLSGASIVALDIETRDDGLKHKRGPGWVYDAGYVTGIAYASDTNQSGYIPLRHPDTACMDDGSVYRWLDRLHRTKKCIYHRAIYDLGWLTTERRDLAWPEDLEDTMVLEFTLDENQLTYNLDDTCRRRGIKGKDEKLLRDAAEAHGCDPKSDLWRLPARYVGPYATQDAVATLELFLRLRPMLEAQDCTGAYRLETDLIPLIIHMRRKGIHIDESRAPQVRSRLLQERNMNLSALSERLQIGRPIEMGDVNSPQFLEKIFKSENLPVPRTAKGNPSFKTEEIEKLDHWLPEMVTGARKMNDAGEKFVGNYIMGFTHLGKIHAEIHPTKNDDGGTRTTRMAYSDPPLQQMPSRNDKIKKMIRGLFLPEKGKIWGALDYSQQEYRLIVHFAAICRILGVDAAVRKYRENPNTDFHTLVAELTGLHRRRAKDVNFAKAFGAGIPKFALMTGMTLEEAAAVMSQYDDEMPFVKGLGQFVSNRAQAKGYIRLIDGARSRYDRWEPSWQDGEYLPPTSLEEAQARVRDKNSPWHGKRLKRAMVHKAMNSLIQGSAARQTKLVMREIWREGIPPILQMHDELDFEFGPEERGVMIRAKQIMVETVRLEVPVVVDAEFGVNWGRASAEKQKMPDGTERVLYDASWESAWEELVA